MYGVISLHQFTPNRINFVPIAIYSLFLIPFAIQNCETKTKS